MKSIPMSTESLSFLKTIQNMLVNIKITDEINMILTWNHHFNASFQNEILSFVSRISKFLLMKSSCFLNVLIVVSPFKVSPK